MTFDPFKPGNFAEGERLESEAHMNYINEKLPYCLDGESGGTYDPAATLSVTKLQCPTTPATGNAVANKTYVDALVVQAETDANAYTDTEVASANAYTDTEVASANAYTDTEVASANAYTDTEVATVAGSLAAFEAKFGLGANISTGNASSLTNISSVDSIRVQRTLVSQYFWIVGVYAVVTNSGSGTKSFELSITQLGTIAGVNNVIGHGNVYNGSNSPRNQGLMIYGVNSTTRVIVEWHDTLTSSQSILRGTFTYYA